MQGFPQGGLRRRPFPICWKYDGTVEDFAWRSDRVLKSMALLLERKGHPDGQYDENPVDGRYVEKAT